MVEYKDVLYKLRVGDLKELIRRYMKEVKIKVSGLKKDELIQHILKHTEYRDNKIVSKVANVDYNISSFSKNMKETPKEIEKEKPKDKSKKETPKEIEKENSKGKSKKEIIELKKEVEIEVIDPDKLIRKIEGWIISMEKPFSYYGTIIDNRKFIKPFETLVSLIKKKHFKDAYKYFYEMDKPWVPESILVFLRDVNQELTELISGKKEIIEPTKEVKKKVVKPKEKTKKTIYTDEEIKELDKLEKEYGVDFMEQVYGIDYKNLRKSKQKSK